mmetsp:Transcript_156563/g.502537  ORF Transcript_156563/g.502537 Transcript_156563/m.502537 type:complete len:284 (-) Transcript_156563:47-898(-)
MAKATASAVLKPHRASSGGMSSAAPPPAAEAGGTEDGAGEGPRSSPAWAGGPTGSWLLPPPPPLPPSSMGLRTTKTGRMSGGGSRMAQRKASSGSEAATISLAKRQVASTNTRNRTRSSSTSCRGLAPGDGKTNKQLSGCSYTASKPQGGTVGAGGSLRETCCRTPATHRSNIQTLWCFCFRSFGCRSSKTPSSPLGNERDTFGSHGQRHAEAGRLQPVQTGRRPPEDADACPPVMSSRSASSSSSRENSTASVVAAMSRRPCAAALPDRALPARTPRRCPSP